MYEVTINLAWLLCGCVATLGVYGICGVLSLIRRALEQDARNRAEFMRASELHHERMEARAKRYYHED